jgi:hypothetical protein
MPGLRAGLPSGEPLGIADTALARVGAAIHRRRAVTESARWSEVNRILNGRMTGHQSAHHDWL